MLPSTVDPCWNNVPYDTVVPPPPTHTHAPSTAVYMSKQYQIYRFSHFSTKTYVVLFDLIIYITVNNFQLSWDGSSWVEPVLSKDKCVLLKDNNSVKPVRLSPWPFSVNIESTIVIQQKYKLKRTINPLYSGNP